MLFDLFKRMARKFGLCLALWLAWLLPTRPATYYSSLEGGAIWPMVGRNQYHTGASLFGVASSQLAIATDGVVVWSLSLCSSSIYSPPVISRDGTIFIGCGATMYAVDSTSRKVRWSYEVGDQILGAGALGLENILYFGSMDAYLYAVLATDGTLVFSKKLTDSIRGGPVIGQDNYVYVGTMDGKIHKISQHGDLLIWSKLPHPNSAKIQGNLAYVGGSTGTTDYLALLTVLSTSTKTLYGETPILVDAANGDQKNYNLNLNYGTLAMSSLSIDPNTGFAFVATSSTQDISGNGPFSVPKWTQLTGAGTDSFQNAKCCGAASVTSCSAIADSNHICQRMGSTQSMVTISSAKKFAYWATGSADGLSVADTVDKAKAYLYVYNFNTDVLITAYDIGGPVRTSPVIDSNGLVYVAVASGEIVALQHPSNSPSTLAEKWRLSMPCSVYSSPALHADGSLIFGGSDGKLYSVGNSDSVGTFLGTTICSTPGQGLDSSINAYDMSYATSGVNNVCESCEVGTYSTGTVCAPCAPGTVSTTSGSSSCSACDAGKYSATFSAQVCTLCAAGAYSSVQGLSSCLLCSAGTVSTTAGSTRCDACSAGFTSQEGSQSCTACTPGTYASSSASSSCAECSEGYYTAAAQSTACSACPVGKTSSADHISCVLCPNGKYSDAEGSTCKSCSLGFTHTDDRRSCVICSWPSFTSEKGSPSCDSFTLVPYRDSADLLSYASITLVVIVSVIASFYVFAILAVECTSNEETQYSGNIVTRLGVAIMLFLPNGCMLLMTLYVLTKNFPSSVLLAFMWGSLLLPAVGFYRLVQDHNAQAWAFQTSPPPNPANGEAKAAAASIFLSRCSTAFKVIFVFCPTVLFGYACYLSRAMVVKRVWNFWFLSYTGNTYQLTRDKFYVRFWNHCNNWASPLQYIPQLVLVALTETTLVASDTTRLAKSWTLVGVLSVLFLSVSLANNMLRHFLFRGRLDAPVELHSAAMDLVLIHFDPIIIDFQDDAPLESGLVRAAVIYNGEAIEEAGYGEVLDQWNLMQATIATVCAGLPACLPAAYFLLLLFSPLLFSPLLFSSSLPSAGSWRPSL